MAHTLRSTFSRCHWTSDVMIGLCRCKLVILPDDFNLQSYKLRSNECQGLVHILRSNVSRCHWTSDIMIGPCRYQEIEAREPPYIRHPTIVPRVQQTVDRAEYTRRLVPASRLDLDCHGWTMQHERLRKWTLQQSTKSKTHYQGPTNGTFCSRHRLVSTCISVGHRMIWLDLAMTRS